MQTYAGTRELVLIGKQLLQTVGNSFCKPAIRCLTAHLRTYETDALQEEQGDLGGRGAWLD
jgi:hypothetical protein